MTTEDLEEIKRLKLMDFMQEVKSLKVMLERTRK